MEFSKWKDYEDMICRKDEAVRAVRIPDYSAIIRLSYL